MISRDLIVVVVVIVFGFVPMLATVRMCILLYPHRRHRGVVWFLLDALFWWRMLRPDTYTTIGEEMLPRLWASVVVQALLMFAMIAILNGV